MEQQLVTSDQPEKKPRKGFVQRNLRGNIIMFVSILLVASIVVGILTLVTGRSNTSDQNSDRGVGREFMFPFVFTDENQTLRVLPDESLKVYEIDDSVTQSVHDAENHVVYYVRAGILYRYSIKQNHRQELVGNVDFFALTENRSGIFIVDRNRNVKLYDGKQCMTLSKKQAAQPATFYSVGKRNLLFLEDYQAEDGTARLCKADSKGNVKRYDFRVNAEKTFALTDDDNRICYYVGEDFYVAELSGKKIASFQDAMPVVETQQAVLQIDTTKLVHYDQSIPVKYLVTALDEGNQDKVLVYFDGSRSREIATGVEEILFYAEEQDMILYTSKRQDGSIKVCYSSGGSKAQTQLSCRADTKFIFDAKQDYLYYQLLDGSLYRYNIYDANRQSVKVANDTGLLYLYPNKPFVAYLSKDSEQVFLVHSDHSVQAYDAQSEWRMYGKMDQDYLFLRAHGDDCLSLDYVDGDVATRISGDVGQRVFFDQMLSWVLYTSNNSFYAWHDGELVKIGNYQSIQAAPIVA